MSTRDELEAAIRRVFPRVPSTGTAGPDTSATPAAAGIGGALLGFVWGYLRGRRSGRSA